MNIKKIIIAWIAFLMLTTANASDHSIREDSLKIYFIGGSKGEKFKVYFRGNLILKYKGTGSYKYSVTVKRISTWSKDSPFSELVIYRKGSFGVNYSYVSYYLDPYDSTKKYLIFYRNPALKNRVSFNGYWSNDEPREPVILHNK